MRGWSGRGGLVYGSGLLAGPKPRTGLSPVAIPVSWPEPRTLVLPGIWQDVITRGITSTQTTWLPVGFSERKVCFPPERQKRCDNRRFYLGNAVEDWERQRSFLADHTRCLQRTCLQCQCERIAPFLTIPDSNSYMLVTFSCRN